MVRRVVLLALGVSALALGIIGAILPILPTTPFVLCAAGCFGASSPKLYRKLEQTKYFGEYIRNYKCKTGISRRARLMGMFFLWLTLCLSAFLIQKPMMWILLAVVGICVSIHIMTIRRKKS